MQKSKTAEPDVESRIVVESICMNKFGTISGLAMLCLLVGCAFGPHQFNSNRAASYAKRHPDLPSRVVDCLLVGQLAEGMTKQAVRICMGSPDRVERVMVSGERCAVWEYSKPALARGELHGSEMWAADIPTARVRFGVDGRVTAWQYFKAYAKPVQKTRSMQADSNFDEPVQTVVPAEPPVQRTAVVKPKADSAEPQVNRIPADWPELKLSGVSVGADAPYAIINRELVAQGGRIGPVTLLYVKQGGVYLKLGESIRFLAIGRTAGK